VYSASKAAVNALGRGIAVELLPRGIRVNVVMPGGSPTLEQGLRRLTRKPKIFSTSRLPVIRETPQ
jgi:NAD(P)-dependent dehydrogenase (short-subunit alcohol dehydrogenase family)